MRKALRSFLLAGFLLLAPVFALGDQITFSFVASPGGTDSSLGTFTVTEVDPTVLADFGLSGFNPSGSVAFTFGQDQVTSLGVLDAVAGGGTVTIVGTVVPEPTSLMLAGTGLLALCLGMFRMKRRPKK